MAPRTALLRGLLVLVAAAAVTVAPSPAAAGAPCWKQVLADWHDNGKIDKLYPVRCYKAALGHVPQAERDYTSIVDDINAAMQIASRGTHQQGSGGPTGGGNNGGSGGGGGGKNGSSGGGGGGKGTHGGTTPSKKSFTRAAGKLGSSGSNSRPLPLRLLGALSLLLLGAAGGMRLYRYVQERRNGARPAHARAGGDRG